VSIKLPPASSMNALVDRMSTQASLAERLMGDRLTPADNRFLLGALRNLRSDELEEVGITESERRFLLEKFKPTRQPWHTELEKAHAEVKSRKLNAIRWDGFLGDGGSSVYGSPYRYSHNDVVAAAKWRPSRKVGIRVTDFTDWVYSLYHENRNEISLARGRRLERELVRRYVPVPTNDAWERIYKGMRSDDLIPAKTITALMVSGQPLLGKPDLVYRERSSDRILIVEIKASDKTIPCDGWPNLRAQLWAYGHIDEWKGKTVLLVGEIWWYNAGKIFLRGRLRWRSDDEDFNRRNLELFDLYRGFGVTQISPESR